jgi:hypothetical protein
MPRIVAMQIGQFMLQRLVTSRKTMLGLWFFPQRSQRRLQTFGSVGTDAHKSRFASQARALALTIDSVAPHSGHALRIQTCPS